MAGTLVISTLSDGANSTSSTNCIQGSAKAWVNFNGVTTATVRASYNVSSVTRNGTGDYTVTFTNAMVDTNYAISGFAAQDSGTADAYGVFISNKMTTPTSYFTTGYVRFRVDRIDATYQDAAICCVSVFR